MGNTMGRPLVHLKHVPLLVQVKQVVANGQFECVFAVSSVLARTAWTHSLRQCGVSFHLMCNADPIMDAVNKRRLLFRVDDRALSSQ